MVYAESAYLHIFHPSCFDHLREMLFAEQWQTPASSHRPGEIHFHSALALENIFIRQFLWKVRVNKEQC